MLVEVREKERLRKGGFVVESTAAVAVATGSNFAGGWREKKEWVSVWMRIANICTATLRSSTRSYK